MWIKGEKRRKCHCSKTCLETTATAIEVHEELPYLRKSSLRSIENFKLSNASIYRKNTIFFDISKKCHFFDISNKSNFFDISKTLNYPYFRYIKEMAFFRYIAEMTFFQIQYTKTLNGWLRNTERMPCLRHAKTRNVWNIEVMSKITWNQT
jgi:hypothetical protein